LLLELPYCDTECFQLFLKHLSDKNPNELKIVVLDNGSFHKANRLKIPENIVLVFLPAYSPELNPAEKIWWFIKQDFVCKTFENINILSDYLCKVIRENINCNVVKSICSYDYFTVNTLD
jgi:transposase